MTGFIQWWAVHGLPGLDPSKYEAAWMDGYRDGCNHHRGTPPNVGEAAGTNAGGNIAVCQPNVGEAWPAEARQGFFKRKAKAK